MRCPLRRLGGRPLGAAWSPRDVYVLLLEGSPPWALEVGVGAQKGGWI